MQLPPLDLPDNPKPVHNITHFARALRRAGLPIGPRTVQDAIRAAAAAGFSQKGDFYWTLDACFVTKLQDRLSACFNKHRSCLVMGQGAVVLLITDGLDRDPDHDLGAEMRRLGLTARQLIWLNPLLRFDGFAPKAAGIAQMLPHVTSLRPAHNIASLQGLAQAVMAREDAGEKHRLMSML